MTALARTGLTRTRRLRAIGLMSGTSADGVDAALIELARTRVRTVAHRTYPYPRDLRRRILDFCHADRVAVDELCRLNVLLGEVFAEAAANLADHAGTALREVDVIGSHGQTVRHLPGAARLAGRRVRATLQIGEPSVVAERTGVTTVGDFRPRDMAAGGQGAPLVPRVDHLLLTHRRRTRIAVNLGGIANLTYLPAGGALEDVLAFDTGPANVLMDRLAEATSGGRRRFDRDGRLAGRGTVCQDLLRELLRHPFLRRRPPKSTGREEFGADLADDLLTRVRAGGGSAADAMATAAAFSVESLAGAVERFLPAAADDVIVSGGGARNSVLLAGLAERLAPARVRVSDEFGIDADAKEAVAFAVLACLTIRGQAGNVPSATGAGHGVVLGKIVPGAL